MTDNKHRWPAKGDQAFRPAMTPGDRAELDAFVMRSEGSYIEGFRRAADMIVDAIPASDLNPDNLFLPVAYLYRHHLELMLKSLVRYGERLGVIDSCDKCLSQHNLRKLWNKVETLILAVWPDSPDDDIKAVARVIQEFHALDPAGQAFRYSRDREGNPSLRDAPERVSLDNLRAVVATVSNYLDATYAGIEWCDPGPS